MPGLKITVEIIPDSAEALADVADVLGELYKIGITPGVQIAGPSIPVTDHDGVDTNRPPAAAPVSPPAATASPPKDRRIRDRTAERRAKREKEAAERAAAQGKPANGQAQDPDPDPDPLDLVDPFGDDGNPNDDDTDPLLPPGSPGKPSAPTPPAQPPALAKQRTEQGYMDAALTVLRCIYDSKDGAVRVKELQKQHKVSKFTDMPLAQAPGLFRTAFDMAQTLGVQLPQGL